MKPVTFRPAAPDELQIDLDRPRARIPKRLLRLVDEHYPIRTIQYSRSKSGNTHVSIRVETPIIGGIPGFHRSLPGLERLFLQVCLGSDPVRELLSWGRARNGAPYPTLFFEKTVDKETRKR
jgi:hypothetical protein